MNEFDHRLPHVEPAQADETAVNRSPVAPVEASRSGPSEDGGGNSILSSFAKPIEMGGDVGAGDAVDFAGERFSNVGEGMDLLHPSGATRGTKALGGTLGATLGLVGSG